MEWGPIGRGGSRQLRRKAWASVKPGLIRTRVVPSSTVVDNRMEADGPREGFLDSREGKALKE